MKMFLTPQVRKANGALTVDVHLLEECNGHLVIGHHGLHGIHTGDASFGQVARQNRDEGACAEGTSSVEDDGKDGSSSKALRAASKMDLSWSLVNPEAGFCRVHLRTFSNVFSCARLYPAERGGGHCMSAWGVRLRKEALQNRPHLWHLSLLRKVTLRMTVAWFFLGILPAGRSMMGVGIRTGVR